MYLHEDKELFKEIISETSILLQTQDDFVEKDYFLTLFLKLLTRKIPNLLFKGGTSLSKCYGVLDRFSEDLDISYKDRNPTEKERRHYKEAISEVCNEIGATLVNKNDIWDKKHFSRYIISLPRLTEATNTSENLRIETTFLIKSYPSEVKTISYMINDYLQQSGHTELISQYDLEPFKVNTQTLERTLIDKIFALCDYYLTNNLTRHSRHIYDIYKILDYVTLDINFKNLFENVRQDRVISYSKNAPSAEEQYSIPNLLSQIINGEIFKEDYNKTTYNLIYSDVPYETAIKGLQKLIECNLLK